MPKLTDNQLLILSAAGQRDDGTVLPLPPSLTINKGAASSILKSLVKRGLVAEQTASRDDGIWQVTKDGQRMTLAITTAGLDALGIDPDQQSDLSPAATKTKTKPRRKKSIPEAVTTAPQAASTTARPGTKQALLIDLLKRKGGATIAEIGEATGWQPHSVRGAISGTLRKKLGLNVASESVDGRGRIYRIVAGA